MNIFSRIRNYSNRIKDAAFKLMNTLWFLWHGEEKFIIVKGWIKQRGSFVLKRNLGDELNYYLIEGLTGKRVMAYDSFFHGRRTNYVVIGSVVEGCNENTVIWGGGAFQREIKPLPTKPKEVLAVRGALTRDYLLTNGVSCPQVYGDPALLLPLIYTPRFDAHKRVGIIPHFNDLKDQSVRNVREYYGDCELISLRGYDDWHTIIDQICNCDAILSSSLHGLILADAYQIPNVWVKFSDKTFEGDFKYMDYFSGVGRMSVEPVDLRKNDWADKIQTRIKEYKRIKFDYRKLLSSCPFAIKKDILNKINNN